MTAKPPPATTSLRTDAIAEFTGLLYIGAVALAAQLSGLSYVLFPELAALAHDVLKRPNGTWARAPLLLVITPVLTAIGGTLVARNLPYGVIAVLITVGGAILTIRLLHSPIAPAISAALLPVTLGVTSFWYPASLLFGTGLLAALTMLRKSLPGTTSPPTHQDTIDDALEDLPHDYSWIPFFLTFLTGVAMLAALSGERLLLYPPLVVIGFEMYAHTRLCPWARRPLILPLACTLTAAAGVLFITLLGVGPIAAILSMAFGIVTLRSLNLHVPPALAVGLLPFVMTRPSDIFPINVAIGTSLLVLSFLIWQKLTAGRFF
ncbi:MAG: HPP family protein [Rhizomicrobium sp.]